TDDVAKIPHRSPETCGAFYRIAMERGVGRKPLAGTVFDDSGEGRKSGTRNAIWRRLPERLPHDGYFFIFANQALADAKRASRASPRGTASTSLDSLAITACKASTTKSALVSRMPRQMPAGLEARRVMSAKPRPEAVNPSSPTASPAVSISAF